MLNPETTEINLHVKQAKDLSPFTNESGTRNMGYHFFHWTGKAWHFRWVEADTDVEWLKGRIEAGEIYIF